jgi:hypothetical protein
VVSVRTPCIYINLQGVTVVNYYFTRSFFTLFWNDKYKRTERTQYNTYRGVADGDAVPGGCLDIDVVVADGHVGEGRPSCALECREEHLPPVLRELADDAVAAVADEREDVVHGEDGLGLRANLETAAVVGEEADPAGARHGLGAHHAVLAAGVPHLHGDGLGHRLLRC